MKYETKLHAKFSLTLATCASKVHFRLFLIALTGNVSDSSDITAPQTLNNTEKKWAAGNKI